MTSENTSMYMPVAPAYGAGNNGFGFGDGAWWIIILFLFAMNGGWGNGLGNNFGGGTGYMANDVQCGFDQNAVITGITGVNNAVTNGFSNVQATLCNGFAGVNSSLANGFAQAEIAANSRQMADMQQNFALQSSLQQCCCDNRAATADLKYTVATEACSDRAAVGDALQAVTAQGVANTQNLLNAVNSGIQAIKDQMCNDKIDSKNERIAELERQLTMANLAASQGAQTAAILANNEAQTAALEQYLAPVPRPAYIVQNPNGCGTWNGCGCGS